MYMMWENKYYKKSNNCHDEQVFPHHRVAYNPLENNIDEWNVM